MTSKKKTNARWCGLSRRSPGAPLLPEDLVEVLLGERDPRPDLKLVVLEGTRLFVWRMGRLRFVCHEVLGEGSLKCCLVARLLQPPAPELLPD